MDKMQIDEIVRAVMLKLTDPAAATPAAAPVADAPAVCAADEGSLPDLGGEEFRTYMGVVNAHRPEVLQEFRNNTAARVNTGRAGPRPRTTALLRFLADHSRSKDTVLKELPPEWVAKKNLLELQSEITSKDEYLTRPDLGRRLCAESVELLKTRCKQQPDVQVVISDGLSTDAITANLDEILPPLLKGLESAGLNVGTPFFVRYGRVKVEDQIGETLGAKVVILLVGERPGLGQSESMSCYMVYSPTSSTVEADRTCFSNIHRGGTPPVEAAAVIVDLAKQMLAKKASGMSLNRSV